MSPDPWHASPEVLARLATDPRAFDETRATSVEAHLLSCGTCRRTLNDVADPSIATGSWAAVADRIDRARAPLPTRMLRRAGVPEGWAQLVGATPALLAAWLGATVVVQLVALTSRLQDAAGIFLATAPLVSLAAVAVVFAPVADPAGEAGVATPLHGLLLVLRRSLLVLVPTLASLVVADVVFVDLGAPAVAWVLPSLALVAGVLALATVVRPETAVGVLAAGWVVVVSWARWTSASAVALADTGWFGTSGQLIAFGLLVAAAMTVAIRRDRFELLVQGR